MSTINLIEDTDLINVIGRGEFDDLCVLIDHITDRGKGRISVSSDVCRRLMAARDAGIAGPDIRALIVEELCRFGGNSLMNLLRGGSGVAYKEIVRDVAKRVKATVKANSSCAQMEMSILLRVLEQSMEKMTEEQKEQLFADFGAGYVRGTGPATMTALITAIRVSGFGAYKMAAVVANAVAKAMLGRGLAFGTTAGMMRGISVFAGPIGWAITAIWTAFDLASPAYRVTVPCVIQIAYMRQRAMTNLSTL
ncbi:YaaW family protein [Stenotrophomonas rhizophila]